MKKRHGLSILALVIMLSLPLLMAAPALACYYGTTVNIIGPTAPVPVGSQVTLIVTEANNSIPEWPGEGEITDVRVNLEPGGYLLNIANLYNGDNGNSVLDPGETWTWHVSVTVNADTKFTAIGHGYAEGNPEWDITYGIYNGDGVMAYPNEKFELQVYTTPSYEGLTPGYWKNHLAAWPPTGYSPTQNFRTVFGVGPNISLLAALNRGGGGADALGRHAVAALLNAAHPNINYPLTTAQVIAAVQNAYATGGFESVKNVLEDYNELEGDISS